MYALFKKPGLKFIQEGFNAFYLRGDVFASSKIKELPVNSVLDSVSAGFYTDETMTPLLDRVKKFTQR
jgi:hypothetical protein